MLSIKNIPENIRARIQLPASKSISNRLLIISALSQNKVIPLNVSESDDTKTMINLIGSEEQIKDAGHAGTTMRFLTAYYSTAEKEVILTGTERMKNRPIKELVEGLRELGAQIEYLEKPGYPPLRIRGKKLKGKRLILDSGISSQFISAILMISPCISGGVEIMLEGDTISYSYINMTISLMREAGADVKTKGNTIIVKEKPYQRKTIVAEPDWSSASYWFIIAGLHRNAKITLEGLQPGSYQGDSGITAMFDNLGVNSHFTPEGLELKRTEVNLKEFHYDFRNNPDMVQSFAPYCIARGIPFYFSGCRSLRIKETDRIRALSNELGKFGVQISYSEDGDLIWWPGDTNPDWRRNSFIETYKDHRMALGMAPLAIMTGSLAIKDPSVISKSYPSFWKDLKNAGFDLEEN